MELKKIQYFLRIVEDGSLSAAAQSLYLSQPTLSRFLAKLEEEVGAPLFTRSKSTGLELTAAGHAYLKTARQINALWQALDLELTPLRSMEKELLFGVHGDHLLPFAAACAQQVMERWPELSVHYHCDTSLEIQRLVAEGMLRLGLCAYEKKDRRLSYTRCSRTEMMLVTAKEHSPAKNPDRRLRLEQLPRDTGFALMREHTVLRECVEHYLQKMKYTPNIRQTYMRHSSLVGVLTGDPALVGFCPANNHSERLAYLPLDPPFYYCQGVCRLENAVLSPAEQMLADLLTQMPDRREI